MSIWKIPYGRSELSFDLPGYLKVEVILPKAQPAHPNPGAAVREALAHPLRFPPLRQITPPRSVAIAINDPTRPLPLRYLLPPLLEELKAIGVGNDAITFIVATGTHKPVFPQDMRPFLPPDFLTTYRLISHNADDPSNLIYLGETARGTPVWVNRTFYEAELRITLGNIEPHHFMGFSGGAKTAAIGLAGRATITANHSMLTHPKAFIGIYDENPMRQDVEEIAQQMGVHLVLNAVLNEHQEIVHVLAGNPQAVMHAGIPLARSVYTVNADADYDLVIASPGGHPKDINLYQAQKALTHASLFARPQGVIILAAACPEGSGSTSFEAFLEGITSYPEAIAKFAKHGFEIGPHKAFQIARQVARNTIILVSEMPRALVEKCLLTYAASIQEALDLAYNSLNPNPRVAIIPYATHTIPSQILL